MGVSIVVGSWVEGGLSDEPIEALLDLEEAVVLPQLKPALLRNVL
jgi:hypothetical protein